MDKETIFKEIRNRAVKDDTDLGDIIYDVLNGLYPNELKEYDLSVLDPRRGVMNPYDIIDVILKDASKEEVEQNETDDIDKQIEQKLKEIELLKQKKEELKDSDILNSIKDISFRYLSNIIYEVGYYVESNTLKEYVDPNTLKEEVINLLKSLKKYSAKQMSSEHFIASIENGQYKLKLVINL